MSALPLPSEEHKAVVYGTADIDSKATGLALRTDDANGVIEVPDVVCLDGTKSVTPWAYLRVAWALKNHHGGRRVLLLHSAPIGESGVEVHYRVSAVQ